METEKTSSSDLLNNPEQNASRVSIINQEIQGSLETIHQGKKILVNFITLYITAVFGFFYYGAYVQSALKTSGGNTDLPKNDFIILGLIGVLLVLIIFLFGGALLGLVTRTIFGTIKQYKHISYMRNLYSLIFPLGLFEANCLNPLALNNAKQEPKLPIRIATSLPYLFGLVNLMFLFSSFYYLKLFLTTNEAATVFLIPAGFFALYYTNLLTKHFTELRIVQEITPLNNEKEVRIKYENIKQEHKKLDRYRISYVFLWVLSIVFFCSFSLNLYQKINSNIINQFLITAQSITAAIIALLSFFVSVIKIETKLSFSIPFQNI